MRSRLLKIGVASIFSLMLVAALFVLFGRGYVADAVGLRYERLAAYGRTHTPEEDLKHAVMVPPGTALLAIDLGGIRERIIGLAWVRDAVVVRLWPDTIGIHLQERVPAAIWYDGQARYLVDAQGVILGPAGLDVSGKNYVILSGEGALEAAPLFLAFISSFPDKLRVTHIERRGGRRWDIYVLDATQRTLRIKLPEEDAIKRVRLFLGLEERFGFLNGSLRGIDLRHPEKIIIIPR